MYIKKSLNFSSRDNTKGTSDLTTKQATGQFVKEWRDRSDPPVYAHVLTWFKADSLVVFGFSMCEDVRLQVG